MASPLIPKEYLITFRAIFSIAVIFLGSLHTYGLYYATIITLVVLIVITVVDSQLSTYLSSWEVLTPGIYYFSGINRQNYKNGTWLLAPTTTGIFSEYTVENKYIKILRGRNHCLIEVVADLNNKKKLRHGTFSIQDFHTICKPPKFRYAPRLTRTSKVVKLIGSMTRDKTIDPGPSNLAFLADGRICMCDTVVNSYHSHKKMNTIKDSVSKQQ